MHPAASCFCWRSRRHLTKWWSIFLIARILSPGVVLIHRNDSMTLGVLGTFLLLVVALLGRWSRSTRLTVDGSTERLTELARTPLAAEDPARVRVFLTALGVSLL